MRIFPDDSGGESIQNPSQVFGCVPDKSSEVTSFSYWQWERLHPREHPHQDKSMPPNCIAESLNHQASDFPFICHLSSNTREGAANGLNNTINACALL